MSGTRSPYPPSRNKQVTSAQKRLYKDVALSKATTRNVQQVQEDLIEQPRSPDDSSHPQDNLEMIPTFKVSNVAPGFQCLSMPDIIAILLNLDLLEETMRINEALIDSTILFSRSGDPVTLSSPVHLHQNLFWNEFKNVPQQLNIVDTRIQNSNNFPHAHLSRSPQVRRKLDFLKNEEKEVQTNKNNRQEMLREMDWRSHPGKLRDDNSHAVSGTHHKNRLQLKDGHLNCDIERASSPGSALRKFCLAAKDRDSTKKMKPVDDANYMQIDEVFRTSLDVNWEAAWERHEWRENNGWLGSLHLHW